MMNDEMRRGRLGLVVATLGVLLAVVLVVCSGLDSVPEVAAQELGAVSVLDAGATSYTADHNSDYLVNRYYGEVDLFVSVDVSETTSIVPTIQHSPDGATWSDGTAFTAITTDTTTYSLLRAPFYGEYVRIEWDGPGTVEYTPTVKAVPRRGCGAIETLVLDSGLTSYTEDHNSTYDVARTGIVDLFVSVDVSETTSIVPTIQHSPDGTTWTDGIAFTAITTDSTGFDMLRTTLFGEYVRVEWDGPGTVEYTPTVKATFQEGCTLSAYEDLRSELHLNNDAAGDFQTRTQADSRFVNVTGDTMTGALLVGADGTSYDVTLYSDTVGDYFLWDQSEEALTITGTNGQDALNIDDGNVDIADNVDIDGTLDVAGATTLRSDVTLNAVTDGGNQKTKNEFAGLPRIKLVALAQGTNPASETVDCMDATPTGEWVEIDAGTNITLTADTSYYRHDTNSIKMEVTTVADNDGITVTLPAQDDLSGLESIGFWILSDEAISSGDLDLTIDDSDGTDQTYNIGAVTADIWSWVEVDISGCDANCNTADAFLIQFTAQGAGALSDPIIYFDELFYWDADDEDALGTAILRDGVLSVVDTEGGVTLAEYTDYIVHEESGNDFIVWISNQSAADIVALVAY